MTTLLLLRTTETEASTSGILLGPSGMKLRLFSLELPWRNNLRAQSCIPEGTYEVKWHLSPKFGWVYKVQNVPNRSEILIHAGNWPKNTSGCILLGKSFSKDAIWNSRSAIQELSGVLERRDFKLRIIRYSM